jgi:hypothetical protein
MATGTKVGQEANDHVPPPSAYIRVTPSFARLAIQRVRVVTPMNKAYVPPTRVDFPTWPRPAEVLAD